MRAALTRWRRRRRPGGKLDTYEVEGPDRAELLQDLAEFQLAVVRCLLHGASPCTSARLAFCWHRLPRRTGWSRTLQPCWAQALKATFCAVGTELCAVPNMLDVWSGVCAADAQQCSAGEQLQRAGVAHERDGELHKERQGDA